MVSLPGPLSVNLAKRFPNVRPTAMRGGFCDAEMRPVKVVVRPSKIPAPVAPRIKFAPTPDDVIEELERISPIAPEDMEELPVPLPVATVKAIVAATARCFGITLTEIKSDRRWKHLVRARQVAMYVCRKMTTKSLPEIGRQIGSRDHTTILHGCRKITELLNAGDAEIAAAVAKVSAQFEPQGEIHEKP